MKCSRCGTPEAVSPLLPLPIHLLRSQNNPHWLASDRMCRNCLSHLHRELIQELMGKTHSELDTLEQQVVQSIIGNELISASPEPPALAPRWSERLSDRISSFGGSWRFLISFGLFLLGWILLNSLLRQPFDPFPFILLNLALSCLASVQAPVILMSQNRQEARDRDRSISDYRVNLKAELEIRQLHLKLDLLLSHHWQQLASVQELQLDLLEDILEQLPQAGLRPPESGPALSVHSSGG